jgi:hypothetical protein
MSRESVHLTPWSILLHIVSDIDVRIAATICRYLSSEWFFDENTTSKVLTGIRTRVKKGMIGKSAPCTETGLYLEESLVSGP